MSEFGKGISDFNEQQPYAYDTFIGKPFSQGLEAAKIQQLLTAKNRSVMYSGSKPLVVCGGAVTEVKDMEEAQRVAEEQAHAKSANAYILKPVRMVSPKRDVVTTELP